MTVISVAVATTTFIYGMCDCTVDSDVDKGDVDKGDVDKGDVDKGDVDKGDVDKGDLSLMHVCGHAQVRSHVSLGID